MKKPAVGFLLLLLLISRIDAIEKGQDLGISDPSTGYGKADTAIEGSRQEETYDPLSLGILGENLLQMFLHYRGIHITNDVQWEPFPLAAQDFRAMADQVLSELRARSEKRSP